MEMASVWDQVKAQKVNTGNLNHVFFHIINSLNSILSSRR